MELPEAELTDLFYGLRGGYVAGKGGPPPTAVDGFYRPAPRPTIYVPDRLDAEPRVRFSVAHELGHHLVYRATGIVPVQDYWEHEAACNWFANEFLLPQHLLAEQAGANRSKWLERMVDIAGRADVSVNVVARAMTRLSAGRVVFLKFQALGGGSLLVIDSSAEGFYEKQFGYHGKIALSHLGLEAQARQGVVVAGQMRSNVGKLRVKEMPLIATRIKGMLWAMVKVNPLHPAV